MKRMFGDGLIGGYRYRQSGEWIDKQAGRQASK